MGRWHLRSRIANFGKLNAAPEKGNLGGMPPVLIAQPYRGRLAPTPTGLLHLGHAATFFTVCERACAAGAMPALRIEDLDAARCKPEFVEAAIEDLRWLGLAWQGGPVFQSHRRDLYLDAWRRLRDRDLIYPCARSRKDVGRAALAPHEDEPVFPVAWRAPAGSARAWTQPTGINWRFRVPDERVLAFDDARLGRIERIAGRDFGDFLVWNRDDVPAYELAVVVDDAAMGITEVVRGEDLLTSTCRQLLIYEALGVAPPGFHHCPLVRDQSGRRLAKRDAALGIRALRAAGKSPADVLSLARAALAPPAAQS